MLKKLEVLKPTRHRVSTTFHIRHCVVNSNETRALYANLPESAQLWAVVPLGHPYTILPSYIWVHAAVMACGRGQTSRCV